MIKKFQINSRSNASIFQSDTGYDEVHFVIYSDDKGLDKSLAQLNDDVTNILDKLDLDKDNIVFSRLYVTDISNQLSDVKSSGLYEAISSSSFSIIQQHPLMHGKFVLLGYCLDKSDQKKETYMLDDDWGNHCKLTGQNYNVHFSGNMDDSGDLDSFRQTNALFDEYNQYLNNNGLTLLSNSIRTWIYVRDIDNNYAGMVDSRLQYFIEQGLNKDTRYIASTGIEAKLHNVDTLVSFDALAISNLDSSQIKRMEAVECMSPTIDYGVTFERGTEVVFGDRSHYYISGTASIDKNGDVLYIGDPEKQTERAIKNIECLLINANCSLDDFMYIIVYLRDPSSITEVKNIVEDRFPNNLPIVFVEGAVCRPSWLVEIEGVLVKGNLNSEYAPFN